MRLELFLRFLSLQPYFCSGSLDERLACVPNKIVLRCRDILTMDFQPSVPPDDAELRNLFSQRE